MPDSRTGLPPRPSLEQLRKQAKDLLRAARAQDPGAHSRLQAVGRRPGGASPHEPSLSAAQLAIARENGFESWPKLVRHVEAIERGTDAAAAALSLRPMIRPIELRPARPYTLPDGTVVTTDEVWRMFTAARSGDIREIRTLIATAPGLALVEYNYTPPLHFAVREGHLALVELLADLGADLAYRTYPFGDSLLTMAEDREHEAIAVLLRARLSRRFALAAGTRAIIDAARAGDLAAVQAELARDPGLARGSNETGETALHQAAHNGHAGIVAALLERGADPDAVRGDGYKPIHLALMPNWFLGSARERSAEIVQALLAHGATYTPFVAALWGDHQFVRDAVLRDRAAANAADTCRHRPISAAVRRGDLPLARLLLEHGADPSLPEEGAPRGHALWIAVHDGNHELARLLLEHGADPNAMVESSGTPMDMARKDSAMTALLSGYGGRQGGGGADREHLERLLAERRLDEVERILAERPELLQVDDAHWGDGILAGPASKGDHAALALLFRLGARVPPVSKWAPYYYFKHEATAAFLLQHGMDPDHVNWHRFSLLHHMAAEGDVGKARLLIEHGADIDAVDDEYRSTPLGVAARRGQRAALDLLLEAGADPTLAGAHWATPIAWARKKGHDDIVRRLEGHGPVDR